MKRAILTVAAFAAALALAVPASAAKRPIVYVVVLDGLERSEVEAGSAPFVSSLLAGHDARATYFPRSRSVMPAETDPNHVAMMSGAFAGRSGTPANAFALYAPLEDEDSCRPSGPFDFTAIPTETSGDRDCPLAEIAFESIIRQRGPGRIATAAIFGKPKLGRIFADSHFRGRRHDADHLWAPCSSGADDDAYCGDVPTNPVSGYALNDELVMDEVIRTIDEGIRVRGRTRRPDLTFVNLHQIDSAGHAAGVGSLYRQAIGLADDQVRRLVAKLRQRREWGRAVLILVSDHGMDTSPQKVSLTAALTDAGIPEEEFLAVEDGSVNLVYLADRRSRGRFALLKRMRAAILAEPGVDEAFYREPNPRDGGRRFTLAFSRPDWKAAGRRSGDIFVTAAPGYSFTDPQPFSNPLPGNHGAPQTRDNFLAVVSGGSMVRQRVIRRGGRPARPQNVDIAPTVMGLFGLAAPINSDGRFLRLGFDRSKLIRPLKPRVGIAERFGQETQQPGSPPQGHRGVGFFWRLGGRFDVHLRTDGVWRPVLRATHRRRLRVRSSDPGDHRCIRVRGVSAAGVRGPWARRCARL